jgi:hypothetical protein
VVLFLFFFFPLLLGARNSGTNNKAYVSVSSFFLFSFCFLFFFSFFFVLLWEQDKREREREGKREGRKGRERGGNATPSNCGKPLRAFFTFCVFFLTRGSKNKRDWATRSQEDRKKGWRLIFRGQ